MKRFAFTLCLGLVLASCQASQAIPATDTTLPATPTVTPAPTSTLLPSTLTATASPSPEPTLSPDITEKIDRLATTLSAYFSTDGVNVKRGVVNGLVDDAAALDIVLSPAELQIADLQERVNMVEDVEQSIASKYGSPGYALFAARCYGNIAHALLSSGEQLAYKDIDEKRARITMSAGYIADVIAAAKLVAVEDGIISDGEDLHEALMSLAIADPLPKGSLDQAAIDVSEWSRRVLKYLVPTAIK